MVPNLKEIQQELRRFILPHCSNKPTGLWSINSDDFISSCPETVDYLKLNNLLDEQAKTNQENASNIILQYDNINLKSNSGKSFAKKHF